MTVALIDGDIVAYRCAASAENEPEEIAIHRCDELMRRIIHEVGADSYRNFLSGANNFRFSVYPAYKANRTAPDPKWRAACKEFLYKEWNAESQEHYEADDLLGINQTDDTIICSLDKDLKMIFGNHYSWEFGTAKWNKPAEFKTISHEAGLKHFYMQLLMGDKTDNVIGIHGIGPKTAMKFLDNCEDEQEMFDTAYDLYDDPHKFLINGICLWICQQYGETWAHILQKSHLTLPDQLKQEVAAKLQSMNCFTTTT